MKDAFRVFDRNNDGFLSSGELRDVREWGGGGGGAGEVGGNVVMGRVEN